MWGQFAKNLGGESLDNMSLLAALQPADIKEAIEATQGNPISRTKLRLVFAVARMMFGMDPVDVGAPVAASAGAEPKTKGARTDTGITLKIKVSSILDQSSDREVERWSREELNVLRSRYRSMEGEDQMKAEEATDDQLSALCATTRVGIAPHADPGVPKQFGQRAAQSPKFTPRHTGARRCKEIPGLDCFATREARPELRPLRATPRPQPSRTGTRPASECGVDRFPDARHWCAPADTRCGPELREHEYSKRNSTKPTQKFQHASRTGPGTLRATRATQRQRFPERKTGRPSCRLPECATSGEQIGWKGQIQVASA